MSEYINIDEAIAAVAYRFAINKDDYERAERQAVDWLPEAEEDVVKVVRCKDCKYWDNMTKWTVCAKWSADPYEQATTEKNDFCSYGERADI